MTGASKTADRGRGVVRFFLAQIAVVGLTLGAGELALRVLDPPDLRIQSDERNALYQYDAELGWSPIPNSIATYAGARAIHARHNALGLRDRDLGLRAERTILVLGDSFVWGMDVEAEERFTDILQAELPSFRIVNAGVSGFGTDQEVLLLKRLWDSIRPDIVVLVFCVDNDRADNSSNRRYGYFKPYFVADNGEGGAFAGMPVPKSQRYYFPHSWLARHSALARLAISSYVALTTAEVSVVDPTEQLISRMRDFTRQRGAAFLVGLEDPEPRLETFLKASDIPFTQFDGAPKFASHGQHWTPEGHTLVARRLMSLFTQIGIAPRKRGLELPAARWTETMPGQQDASSR